MAKTLFDYASKKEIIKIKEKTIINNSKNIEPTRKCSKCGKFKSYSEFSRTEKGKYGLGCMCKGCQARVNKIYAQKNPYKVWSSNALRTHKYKGHKIDISLNQLIKIAKTTKNCFYCGTDLDFSFENKGKKVKSNSPSLDRINNEDVITPNNIMIICNKCNMTKQDRTMKEFIEYCKNIANKFKDFSLIDMNREKEFVGIL